MRKLVITLMFIVGIFMFSPRAGAYVIDGYVSDWGVNLLQATNQGYLNSNPPSGGLDINYITEDAVGSGGYVGPGWGGQTFDAEAIYFDNDAQNAYIAIITGLPESGAYGWHPGDIGIDVGGDGVYEFGIKVTTSKLYSNLTAGNWKKVHYSAYSEASPWRMKNITNKPNVSIPFVYSSEQNTHYVLEASIPLNLLGLSANPGDPITPLTIHWTMECGNDYLNLNADVNPVPEPMSFLLLGMGLLGLAGMKFKRIRISL